jgi:hypothetical protein
MRYLYAVKWILEFGVAYTESMPSAVSEDTWSGFRNLE